MEARLPQEASSPLPEPAKEDLTGRERLVSNVLFNWAGLFVFIVAGFILPRMIDRRLGQEVLGVWDFAWSLVSYFFMIEAGIGGAVSRYVARYHAAGDTLALNRTISSGTCILGAAGAIVLGLTVTFSRFLPGLFGARLGEHVEEAQWVVFFLGAGLAIQIAVSAFGGVLSGCHRWGLLNMNLSAWHAATICAMIVALLLGRGLTALAAITFGGLVLTYITQVLLAYHACRGLQFCPSLVGWKTIRDLYVFGGKSLIPILSRMLLNQTTSILIVAYLGPAALALYSRPRSLMLHVDKLVEGMARTLTPTTSSLQPSDRREEIQHLLIASARYSLYIVLPIVLVLAFFGGAIIQVWMGPRYANGLIPLVLAVGFMVPISQRGAMRILVGLNAHGRTGMAEFLASVCSAVLTVLTLKFLDLGLVGVAVAVTLPLTLMNLTYLPLLVCRRVNLRVRQYFASAVAGPVVHILPFAVCLAVARLGFRGRPLTGLAWGGMAGGVLLGVLYYRYVLPERIRTRLSCIFGARRSLA